MQAKRKLAALLLSLCMVLGMLPMTVFAAGETTAEGLVYEVNGESVTIVYAIDFDVTPHQLRHTYITNLLYAGIDPKTVQYLAGHENSKTTMDIYAQVKYNKPEELLSVVNAAFAPSVGV